MKILYILRQTPDKTLSRLIEEHRDANEVSVIYLGKTDDYGVIVDQIAETDKVISW